MNRNPDLAAVVLCGGRSRRMGRPKHSLPFGTETALQRIVRTVGHITDQVVVIGFSGIEWPQLPKNVQTLIDSDPFPGPLAALVQGFESLPENVTTVLLAGCDFPMISVPFWNKLIAQRDEQFDIIAVQEELFPQPFAAIYRRTVLPTAKQLLSQNDRSLQSLLKNCRSKFIPAEEFRTVDPELDSLRNLNHEADYLELLTRAAQNPAPV